MYCLVFTRFISNKTFKFSMSFARLYAFVIWPHAEVNLTCLQFYFEAWLQTQESVSNKKVKIQHIFFKTTPNQEWDWVNLSNKQTIVYTGWRGNRQDWIYFFVPLNSRLNEVLQAKQYDWQKDLTSTLHANQLYWPLCGTILLHYSDSATDSFIDPITGLS